MYLDPNEGGWSPKPFDWLTEEQQYEVTKGRYRCLPVHPSQSYASLAALAICGLLYTFWRPSVQAERLAHLASQRWWHRPGLTFCLMLVFYGVARFLLELTRDDNPFEFAWLTISQIIGLGLIVLGLVLAAIMVKLGPGEPIHPTDTE
jgi:prolipoprotein diacylglyceryltransferase